MDYTAQDRAVLYGYGPDQNRVMKAHITKIANQDTTFTYYIRDAQGNIMAIYEREDNTVTWKEQHLYGSNRLGTLEPNVTWTDDDLADVPYFTAGTLIEGWKRYELSNHLGNVLTVINDRQVGGLPTILSANDYFPFGMAMPNRAFSSPLYRYGFNGKEKDSNFGELTHYDFGNRIYWSGGGRWLSIDPLQHEYPHLSPFIGLANNPLIYIDPDGKDIIYSLSYDENNKPIITITVTGKVVDYADKWITSAETVANRINAIDYLNYNNINLTGLNLTDINGKEVLFEKDKNGNPITGTVQFKFDFDTAESIIDINEKDHVLVVAPFRSNQLLME